MAWYGKAGAGKTTLLREWLPLGPMLYHNIDHKDKPLANVENLCILDYDTRPDSAQREYFEHKRKFQDARIGKLTTADFKDQGYTGTEGPFVTQVIDSGTYFAQMACWAALKLQGKKETGIGIDDQGKLKPTDNPDMRTYVEYSGYMRACFALWKSRNPKLPQWTIITWHEIDLFDKPKDMNDVPGIRATQPLCLGDKILQELPGQVEEIWHISRKTISGKDRVKLRYKPYDTHIANSTMLEGSGEIENPTFESIMEHCRK